MSQGEEEISQVDQQEALVGELERTLFRFVNEFDLTYCSIIGALEIVKSRFMLDCLRVVRTPRKEE